MCKLSSIFHFLSFIERGNRAQSHSFSLLNRSRVCICSNSYLNILLPLYPLIPSGQINTVPMKFQVGYLDVVGEFAPLILSRVV